MRTTITISDNKRLIVNRTLLRYFSYSLHQSKSNYTNFHLFIRLVNNEYLIKIPYDVIYLP